MPPTSSVATFFVANPGHHTAMVQPVVKALASAGRRCRVLSLCELRGFETPRTAFALDGVEVRSLVPLRLRKAPGGASVSSGRSGTVKRLVRRVARRAVWTALERRTAQLLGRDTAVAVLPNDAAYPYGEIAALLRRRRTPFVLLQEGVRFHVPGGEADGYGRGGAAAIAAWGESSAEYFRAQGAPAHTIHLTGSPRFDGFDPGAWLERGREVRDKLGLGDRKVVVMLSNPIELLGLTRSTDEKIALVAKFCEAAQKLADGGARVLVKLHASEPARDFRAAIGESDAVRIVEDVPLYALLAAANAAVILASTVGMEALLFDLQLGVIEVPRVGYAFDYVQRGAAIGLGSSVADMERNLDRLVLGEGRSHEERERYLAQLIAVRSGATGRVADLVERCARS